LIVLKDVSIEDMASTSKKSNISLDILSKAHNADFATTYYRDKVIQRPFYLKPTPKDDNDPDAREIRQKARTAAKLKKQKSPGKPKPLSAKQKRVLQIYTIPKDQQKYEIYIPLHQLWCGYMREVLGLDKPDSPYGRFVEARTSGPLLTSADYHGALLEVARSKCVSRVGVTGIVVRDTRETFEVITVKNGLKSMFCFMMTETMLTTSSYPEGAHSFPLRNSATRHLKRCRNFCLGEREPRVCAKASRLRVAWVKISASCSRPGDTQVCLALSASLSKIDTVGQFQDD
jgi:ribonuclease P protein subunit POP4